MDGWCNEWAFLLLQKFSNSLNKINSLQENAEHGVDFIKVAFVKKKCSPKYEIITIV